MQTITHDALELVLYTQQASFRSSTAYDHYFLPEEWQQVINMYQSVADVFTKLTSYHVAFKCGTEKFLEWFPQLDIFSIADYSRWGN